MHTSKRGLWLRVIGVMCALGLMHADGWAATTRLADLPWAAQAVMSAAIGQDQAGYQILPAAEG